MSDRKRREETPRTLRELGVPDELTKDLEAAFKAMGKTTGDRIVGFTFVTPEGARHRLRLEREPSDPAGDRAAQAHRADDRRPRSSAQLTPTSERSPPSGRALTRR
ncbi:MAG TPA: hypothetical protein VE034_09835 [Burkholderiales bacterium]|nr:hypothetical protein [Burkholderiales bacterium]